MFGRVEFITPRWPWPWVAAIPGLPAHVVSGLRNAAWRERNVIVQKLPSVETLGCVTVICTTRQGHSRPMTAISLVLLEQ
jgi:hypothetical protein